MPKSQGHVEGYMRAISQWEQAELSGVEWLPLNPYQEGTDEFDGYEDAYYDLTQK